MAVSYRDGFKYDSGRRIPPVLFAENMSSNGRTVYTATKWADGTASCNCPGFANRQACKHTKEAMTLTEDKLLQKSAEYARNHDYLQKVNAARDSGRGFDL